MKYIYPAIFLFLFSCGNSGRINKESHRLSLKSDTLIQKGKFEEALNVIEKALKIDDKNYIAYNNLGYVKQNLGYPENEILEAFTKSYELNNDYLIGLFSLTNYQFYQKKYQKTIDLGKKYLKKVETTGENFETRAHIYTIIGESYNYLNSYKMAHKYLTNSININPSETGAYKERGIANRNLGNLQNALLDLNKAIELETDYHQAFNSRAILYEDFNEPELALQDYNIAIELNPNSGLYYFNRGTYLIDLGRIGEACEDLNIALSLGHDEAKSYIEEHCK